MSLRVLIVPDKFKGTLTALQAAGAMANGWWNARPADQVEILPMSDGGDGFGEVLGRLLGGEERACPTVDAAGRPRDARWWSFPQVGVAVVESAQSNGLALLPPGRFHPYDLDTRGVAPLLRAAADSGAARCLIGVGGSATNDAGFGVARELGWRFLDAQGNEIDRWVKLARLAKVEMPTEPVAPSCEFVVAVDVDNPLLGHQGCTRVYGPQKGLMVQQAPVAEAALQRLAEVLRDQHGIDHADEPGAGAAGGLGFGLKAFLGARIESGFELFAFHADLDARIQAADLVITGEGSLDAQSLMGKGTGRVAQRCRQFGKPCIGLAGMVEGAAAARTPDRLFHSAHGLTPGMTTPMEAKQNAALWLERLAARVASEYEG